MRRHSFLQEAVAYADDKLHNKELEGHGKDIAQYIDGIIPHDGEGSEAQQNTGRQHGHKGFALNEDDLCRDKAEADDSYEQGYDHRYNQ